MLAYLEGTIIATSTTGAIVQVGALGYEVTSLLLSAKKPGQSVTLFTALHVGSDNQPLLLGFDSIEARAMYYQLIKVSGIGPKSALRIIESAPLDSLKTAILEGDLTFFTRVKGLGKKNAQKIILELKHTLVETDSLLPSSGLYSALRALKFTPAEIDQSVRNLDLSGLDEASALKLVLQSLGRV